MSATVDTLQIGYILLDRGELLKRLEYAYKHGYHRQHRRGDREDLLYDLFSHRHRLLECLFRTKAGAPAQRSLGIG